MYNKATDEELMMLVVQKDQKAFEEIFNRYSKNLYNYIFRLIYNKENVDDLIQEIFVKIYFNADKYDIKYKFSTWLYKVALNTFIDYCKKTKKRKTFYDEKIISEKEDVKTNTIRNIIIDEEMNAFKNAINTMNPKTQQIFMLKFYQSFTFDEIAKIVNISSRSAKNYMDKAKKHIKKYFQDFEYD